MWNPHHTSQIATIEKVQKFALRMCYKNWREQYVSLLERSGIQSLADRRKLLDICYLFQLLTGVFNFPDAPLMPRNLDSRLRNFDPQLLCLPFARTTELIFSSGNIILELSSFFPFTLLHHFLNLSIMFCLIFNFMSCLLYMCMYLSVIFVLYSTCGSQ